MQNLSLSPKTNNPGDLIKGRTFRRLNVTRKIVIKDVPSLFTTALSMQTFALCQRCIRQRRGSPMGSPLSPALCLMVVSISEQIWSINFKQILSNHHLLIKHIRYVDNRLILAMLASRTSHTKSSWTKVSTESQSSSKLNLTKRSSASCLKLNPLSWYTMDLPKFLRSSHHILQKFSSAVSDPDVIWSIKEHSRTTGSGKA